MIFFVGAPVSEIFFWIAVISVTFRDTQWDLQQSLVQVYNFTNTAS